MSNGIRTDGKLRSGAEYQVVKPRKIKNTQWHGRMTLETLEFKFGVEGHLRRSFENLSGGNKREGWP